MRDKTEAQYRLFQRGLSEREITTTLAIDQQTEKAQLVDLFTTFRVTKLGGSLKDSLQILWQTVHNRRYNGWGS